MDIFEFAQLRPVKVLPTPASGLVTRGFIAERQPFILDRFADHWKCGRTWTLERIGQLAGNVKVSRPSSDGIYRYHQFESMPFAEFAKTMATSRDVYLGLDPIYRANQSPYVPEGLRGLAADLESPDFIDHQKVRSVNLWVGPGGNKTLLHYDPWEGLLIVLNGRKRVALFPPDQSSKMYGYSVFNLKSVFEHKVLDSRINPSRIDPQRDTKIAQARGFEAVVEEGQALFIPAGCWHYVESEGINVAVNFFWSQHGWLHQLKRPILDYRLKRMTIVSQEAVIRFIRTYIFPKRFQQAIGRALGGGEAGAAKTDH